MAKLPLKNRGFYNYRLAERVGSDFGHRQAVLVFHTAHVTPGTKSRGRKTRHRRVF